MIVNIIFAYPLAYLGVTHGYKPRVKVLVNFMKYKSNLAYTRSLMIKVHGRLTTCMSQVLSFC